MSELLHLVFVENEKDLVRDVMQQLRHSTSPHYTTLDDDVLHQRVADLIAYFMISLKETPDQFTKYIGGIAEERFVENYSITECLSALRTLEEKAWALIVREIPQQDLVHALTRVTGNIGAAKDLMAKVFVEHLERGQDRPSAPVAFTD